MKTLYCGKIPRDDVMDWCTANKLYTQHDQFLLGYEWFEHEDEYYFTNNDHFLNGVRLAVKDGKAEPEDLDIIFMVDERLDTRKRVLIDKNGRLDHWPIGFFDEWTRVLIELL